MMRHLGGLRLELVLSLALSLLALHAADSNAEFIGGTISSFKVGDDGQLNLTSAEQMTYGSRQYSLAIPYPMVRSIEYGQKVDRRYLEAFLISPLFLLSKKRAHYLTIHFRDNKGLDQAIVLRLSRSAVRPMLASLEARTGLKVKVQDDEARKAYRS
ncbi:MAG: hypothetical protein ACK5TN_21370 [Acidobacteriota bacterium]